MIKAYKEEVFCAVVSEMIAAQESAFLYQNAKGRICQLRVTSEYKL